jgi:hypothetical protein
MYEDPVDLLMQNMDKRKAGALLAAYLTPTLLSLVDNQQEDALSQVVGAPLTVIAGAMAGGTLARATGNISEDAKAEALRKIVTELKNEAKGVRDKDGPVAANEFFGHEKAKRTAAYEQDFKKIPGLGISPRDIRRGQTGSLIGAALSAPLAYSMLRGGEIEQ